MDKEAKTKWGMNEESAKADQRLRPRSKKKVSEPTPVTKET